MNETHPTHAPVEGDPPAKAGPGVAAARRPAYALLGFVVFSVGLGVLLWLVPEIDLRIEGLFYRQGDGFFLQDSAFAMILYKGILRATPVLVVGLIAVIGLGLIGRFHLLARYRRPAIVLLGCLVIGAGLVVNTAFKDNWGRARPSQTVEFGGTKTFTPPFVITDQCARNCSFVAGHPSILFAFFGLALFARRRRALAIGTVAVLGGIAGLGRIMQGAHFPSDVVYSGVFTFVTAWLLYRLVIVVLANDGSFSPVVRLALRRRPAAEE